ncbi:lysM domain-containing GPI-anchored protein 2 isoform X1 [Jatropha curcas]|uniref:lysM domain-containing GPI-anchored protein 2 isoform X1 n=1 Tax=Jatropha curcas TaxID=180498 RepID=UPI0005FAA3B5|nr:lysM domain-containing GPI-anchored protein 2 isoform X1 [Jatropha curcas]
MGPNNENSKLCSNFKVSSPLLSTPVSVFALLRVVFSSFFAVHCLTKTEQAMILSSAPLLLSLLLFAALATSSLSQPFKCTTSGQCNALIDYVAPNSTTISDIRTLFSIKNLRSILGANNLPLSTSPNQTIAAAQTIKIPFPCKCSNGTGISNKKPIYTVQPGDGLDHIARDVFSALVTYEQIAAVNNIPDVNKILVGQELQIPLPCSCDDVGGEKVVHYGHVVESGSSLDLIAQEYGTTMTTLMTLNSITNASSLKAGQVLDVPLKACNSSVSTTSIDYPLLVPNGTYFFTANSCVKCNCDAANNWTLQCEPSGFRPAAKSTWSTCPSMRCDGATSLLLSNTTTTGCNTSTCAYAGFSSQNILTTLATVSTCPATGPGIESPDDNYASRISLSWSFLRISLPLIMLSVHLN